MSEAKALTWNWSEVSAYGDATHSYCLTDSQAFMLRTALYRAIWSTRWFDRPPDFGTVEDFVNDAWLRLLFPEPCDPPAPPPTAPNGSLGGGATINDLLDILEELNMKYRVNGELYEVVLDLVPCDCGGAGSTDQETATGVGGTTGGSYGEFTTLCDFISDGAPRIVNLVDNFLGRIQSGSYVLDQFFELSNTLVGNLIDSVDENLAEIEGELTDPDFLTIVENNMARAFNDPVSSDITRTTLLNFAYRIPLVFEGAPMWSAFVLWAAQANLNEVNAIARNSRGLCSTAGSNALARVNRTPFDDGGEDAPVDIDAGGYRLSRFIFNQTVFANDPVTIDIAEPREFLITGFMFRISAPDGQSSPGSSITVGPYDTLDGLFVSTSTANARQNQLFIDGNTVVDIHGDDPAAIRANLAADSNTPQSFAVGALGPNYNISFNTNLYQDDKIPVDTSIEIRASGNRIILIEEAWIIYDL